MAAQRGGAGFRVHPDELLDAGRAAEDVAAGILAELRSLFGPSDRAAGVLSAWQTGPALDACTEAWRALLTRLAAELDRGGQNLVACARAYRAADADAAAHLTTAARG